MSGEKRIVKGNKKPLDVLADEITARGNDMEVRHTKDGIKVFEVKRQLCAVFERSSYEQT